MHISNIAGRMPAFDAADAYDGHTEKRERERERERARRQSLRQEHQRRRGRVGEDSQSQEEGENSFREKILPRGACCLPESLIGVKQGSPSTHGRQATQKVARPTLSGFTAFGLPVRVLVLAGVSKSRNEGAGIRFDRARMVLNTRPAQDGWTAGHLGCSLGPGRSGAS